jgi:general secretion pathway protein F
VGRLFSEQELGAASRLGDFMDPSGRGAQPTTLEDLAALNREMASLVRAGLPLEAGLRQVADDLRGGAGRLAARLAERTAAGMSLADAVAAEGDSVPPVYRAVVAAGLKSGRLSAALEGFAETAARVAELRRVGAQAAIYPFLVVSVAWIMAIFVLARVIPQYDWLDINDRFWVLPLELSDTRLLALALGVPVLALIVAIAWWRRTAKASSGGRESRFLGRIPGVRRAVGLSGQANFADLLATLLRCAVPIAEALPLAARASGAAKLEAPAAELAAQISRGEPLAARVTALREMPPLIRTALLNVHGDSENGMVVGLQRAATVYRERATAWVTDLAVLLPVAMTLAIGVGVVGMYAVLLLQPYFALLRELLSWS